MSRTRMLARSSPDPQKSKVLGWIDKGSEEGATLILDGRDNVTAPETGRRLLSWPDDL